MGWIEPIYDRTAADITNRTSKAFFNILDWVRIYGNTQQIQAIVNVMLSLSIPITRLTQPAITTIPAVADINSLIDNIEQLRVAACLPVATGAVSLKSNYLAGNSADAPDYIAVNTWEEDIQLIRECLHSAASQVVYCGMANCGQTHLIQVHWRKWRYVFDANDPGRRIRTGAIMATSLNRQNKFRSLVDHHRRHTRCGISNCGSGLLRQNGFRRYA
jgi:hypothetical protein